MARMDIPTQRRGIVGTGGVRRGVVVNIISPTRAYVQVPRLYEGAALEASLTVLPRTLVVGDRVFVAAMEGRWDDLVIIGLEA